MNKEELKGLLPHREPMLLLDEAEVVDGEAHGKITITGDEFFVQGHFPGNPIVHAHVHEPQQRALQAPRAPRRHR